MAQVFIGGFIHNTDDLAAECIQSLRDERDDLKREIARLCAENEDKLKLDSDYLTEALAAYAHEAWVGWMNYLFTKTHRGLWGSLNIPEWAVTHWKRQCATAYRDLAEHEKDTDRVEAETILVTIRKALASQHVS